MRPTTLLLSLMAARTALAQVTVTEYVTLPEATSTPSATSPSIQKQAVSAEEASSTFATSTPASVSTAPTQAVSSTIAAQGSEPSTGGNAVDTEAGASGSDQGSFSISKGGVAAIAVVVGLVAIFGIVTTILFVVAKRKQWTMRETMSRASKAIITPLTPRFPKDARQPRPLGSPVSRRQTTLHAGRLATPKDSTYPASAGHKRGLRVEEKESRQRDVEKGIAPLKGKAPEQKRGGGGWVQRLWDNDWK